MNVANQKQYDGVIIYEGAKIGQNVHIGYGTIIYPNVVIEDNCFVGPYCILGEPVASFYNSQDHFFKKTIIGANSIIRSHSVIYEDVQISQGFQTGHRVTIREESIIGKKCSVGTLSDLQGKLRIGDFVRLHSNVQINQMSVIEDYVWIYPFVVLTNDPYPPLGRLKGVTVRRFAQIAAKSVILAGVEIGENALIGAATFVRKDVGPERIVVGVPGKDIGSVRDFRDNNGEQVYPWKDYLKDFRGYPWQVEEE